MSAVGPEVRSEFEVTLHTHMCGCSDLKRHGRLYRELASLAWMAVLDGLGRMDEER